MKYEIYKYIYFLSLLHAKCLPLRVCSDRQCFFFSSRNAIRSVARSAPWPTALNAAMARAATPRVWYVYIWSSCGCKKPMAVQSSDLFPPRSPVVSAGLQLPLRRERL